MAVSKNTRRSDPDTNKLFQTFFQDSQVSQERERAWYDAVRDAGTGTPPLRFPVYEHLYFLNIYAGQMVDLLKEMDGRFGIGAEYSLYCQAVIQQVRASISCDIAEYMAGIEHTDAWLFESQRRAEEKHLHDLDDIYLQVREREIERIDQGLPPRIEFLDEKLTINKESTKSGRPDKSGRS